MRIESLSIANFRNISLTYLSFNKKPIIYFIGQNGQGKTNLLESIYILLTGSSFRCSQMEYFKPKNILKNPKVLLKGVINNNKVNHLLEFQINFTKSFKLDNKKTSYLKLLQTFQVVIFSPESLFIIKDGPEARRKAIDDLILFFYPKDLDILSNFVKILRTRNKILKNIRENTVSYQEGTKLLESLEPSFLNLSAVLTNIRLKVIRDIEPFIRSTLDGIFKTVDTQFSLEYVISGQILKEESKDEIYGLLSNRLTNLKDAEIQAGVSLVGPHKHDINFIYEGRDARFYCSQGQQKALILAFKISQVLYYKSFTNSWPILLLDDVLSELDKQKGVYLLDFLKSHNVQTFITSTEFLEDFNKLDIQLYSINEGNVQKIIE